MDWHLVVCGINHRTSSIAELGPFQIGPEEAAKAYAALDGVMEATIVSTCNRVEFYLIAEKWKRPLDFIASFYLKFRGMDISSHSACFYTKENAEAVRHLFKVAAGLDSMILGENQILGQIKDAYSAACSAKVAGKVNHRLFHQAFRVGKQVRSDTEMGKGHCSVSSAAVEILKPEILRPGRPVVLFVGVSPMIALAAQSIYKLNGASFLFANRTEQKAVELGQKYNSPGYSLSHMPSLLARADIVITCTASPVPIITRGMISDALAVNPGKRLVIMDMAVPPDVEKVNAPLVKVYDLEDIKRFVQEQHNIRKAAIPKAEEIVEIRLGEFLYWFDNMRYDPLCKGVEHSFELIRRQEMDAVLEKLPPELREEVNSATIRLLNRVLQKIHSPAKGD